MQRCHRPKNKAARRGGHRGRPVHAVPAARAGFSVHGFEQGDGVGGTWYWNRYPGARGDSESMYYSYSFLPELEQEWPLEERYPGQPEILRYLRARRGPASSCAQDFTFERPGHRRGRTTGREPVDGAHRGGTTRRRRRYLITAVGCLSTANKPEFPGADSFAGRSLHTGSWPREPVDFTGKRVGVIGTGRLGHPGHPGDRRAGRAPDGVPAHGAVHHPGRRTARWTRSSPRCGSRTTGNGGGAGAESHRRDPVPAQQTSALEVPPRSAGRLRGRLAAGGFMFTAAPSGTC